MKNNAMPFVATRSSGARTTSDAAIHAPATTPWINLLGVRVSAINIPTAVERILGAIAAGQKGYICVRDVHGMVRCQKDTPFRHIHNRAFLVTPDGMPLVWALRLSGHKDADRVYGPDLMMALFDHGRTQGIKHFLYGASPHTLALLKQRLLEKFPDARIVGTYSPPFRDLTDDEEQSISTMINESGADVLWVGLSTPKQELWMARMRQRLTASMLIGVGAAFDFHAGVKRQAPRFIQRSGCEWMFRLACEPRRLWRRYAVAIPSFIVLALSQLCKLKEFRIDPDVGGELPVSAAGRGKRLENR